MMKYNEELQRVRQVQQMEDWPEHMQGALEGFPEMQGNEGRSA